MDFQNTLDFIDLQGAVTFSGLALAAIARGVRATVTAAPANHIDLMGVELADITAAVFI